MKMKLARSLFVLLAVSAPGWAREVAIDANLPGRWSCIGYFDRDYILEKVDKFGPKNNHGNPLMSFSYLVATHVVYPLTDHAYVLRIKVESDQLILPAGDFVVHWDNDTWPVDSLFTVYYDTDPHGLKPQVVPLGSREMILRRADVSIVPGEDPMEALRGVYFGEGKGPSDVIHLFARIPTKSASGREWDNRGEPFRFIAERR